MSTAFEYPSQFERDLRGANREWQRGKEARKKWSLGVRPLAGVRFGATGEILGGSEHRRSKTRPRGKNSEESKHPHKLEHNAKATRGNWEMAAGRVQSKYVAADEIRAAQDSLSDSRSLVANLLPAKQHMQHHRVLSDAGSLVAADAGVLYSFDHRETNPNKPVSLDIFVKQPTGREMEKLVEKEYEILDVNGQALRGRKARAVLRNAASTEGSQVRPDLFFGDEADDDGFELV